MLLTKQESKPAGRARSLWVTQLHAGEPAERPGKRGQTMSLNSTDHRLHGPPLLGPPHPQPPPAPCAAKSPRWLPRQGGLALISLATVKSSPIRPFLFLLSISPPLSSSFISAGRTLTLGAGLVVVVVGRFRHLLPSTSSSSFTSSSSPFPFS